MSGIADVPNCVKLFIFLRYLPSRARIACYNFRGTKSTCVDFIPIAE